MEAGLSLYSEETVIYEIYKRDRLSLGSIPKMVAVALNEEDARDFCNRSSAEDSYSAFVYYPDHALNDADEVLRKRIAVLENAIRKVVATRYDYHEDDGWDRLNAAIGHLADIVS